MTYTKQYGHPVLGIVLGILGIIAALLLCVVSGVVGGAIAGVLGLAALLTGLNARKGGKGVGAIVLGILAVVLAISLTVGTVNLFRGVRKEAARYAEEAPLVVRSLEKPEFGFVGMFLNLPNDEGTLDELTRQFNLVKDKVSSGAVPAATAAPEAPAAEPAG